MRRVVLQCFFLGYPLLGIIEERFLGDVLPLPRGCAQPRRAPPISLLTDEVALSLVVFLEQCRILLFPNRGGEQRFFRVSLRFLGSPTAI